MADDALLLNLDREHRGGKVGFIVLRFHTLGIAGLRKAQRKYNSGGHLPDGLYYLVLPLASSRNAASSAFCRI